MRLLFGKLGLCLRSLRIDIAGPCGAILHISAAGGYNRSGAAEDTLAFQAQDRLAPCYAVWFPGRNATETAAAAAATTWQLAYGNAILRFPGHDGKPDEMKILLP